MDASTLKQPSGWVPLAMSFTALVVVLIHLVISGTAREADEGTTAHLFQLLMAGQVPVVVFFAFKWLPRSPRRAWMVMALQAAAAIAALTPVFYFHL